MPSSLSASQFGANYTRPANCYTRILRLEMGRHPSPTVLSVTRWDARACMVRVSGDRDVVWAHGLDQRTCAAPWGWTYAQRALPPGVNRTAVALLVVLAGCAGLGAPPTDTVTPAPVPGDGPETVAGTTLPPGVSATGLENVTALAEAHVAAAEGRSYWLVIVVRRGSDTETFRARVGDGRYLAYHGTFDRTNRTVYGDEDRTLVRYEGTPPRYATRATSHEPPAAAVTARVADTVQRYLSVDSSTVEVASVDGVDVLRIEGHGARNVSGAVQYDAVAYVEPSGFVRSFRVEFLCTTDRRCDRVTVVLEHGGLEETSVSRPAWYDDALAATERPANRSETDTP